MVPTEEINKSEEPYRLLFENNPQPMWVYDLETLSFLAVNEAAIRYYGYSREQFLSMTIKDIRPPEDVPVLLSSIAEPTTGLGAAGLWTHRKKDGSLIKVEITSHTLVWGGRPAELVLANDVTEQKRVESALKASEAELRSLFAAMTDIVLVLDVNGRYLKIAPTNPGLLYRPAAELIGKTLHDVFPAKQADFFLENIRLVLNTREMRKVEYSMLINGTEVWFDGNISPMSDDSVIFIAHDITERKRAEEALHVSEEQLRQSQKMEAIGLLAGGIAHDFNNLMAVILLHSDLMLMRLGPSDPLRRRVEEIKATSERAASLTRQLLAFSRKQVLQPKVLNLNETVSNIDKILQRLIGEHIELRKVLDPALGQVQADPGQIEQVILNLAVNARDAMPDGGKLVIQTENVFLDKEYASYHVSVKPGRYVRLTVSDTGHGMDAETQQHIFEPFFTTKELGKGTGLGLSTVYGIIKQSGGNIWVYSEPGSGTTFKIYLPRTDEVTENVETNAEQKALQGGSETILLVEDEAAFRKATRELLEISGYQVLETANGNAALEICAKHEGTIHLLLTDVVMPKMSGRELAERLQRLRPGLKVLYMSGYTDETIVHHGILDEEVAFIEKPFSSDALTRKIREVLDAH